MASYGEWELQRLEPTVKLWPAWLIVVLVQDDPCLCKSNTPAACIGFPRALDETEQLPFEVTLSCSCPPLTTACGYNWSSSRLLVLGLQLRTRLLRKLLSTISSSPYSYVPKDEGCIKGDRQIIPTNFGKCTFQLLFRAIYVSSRRITEVTIRNRFKESSWTAWLGLSLWSKRPEIITKSIIIICEVWYY